MSKLKAIILILAISSTLLLGCSNKYKVDKPGLTEEQKTTYEQEIDGNLEILNKDDITETERRGAWTAIAIRYHFLGEYDKAIEYYEQILKFHPTSFIALNNITDLYEEIEEYKLAAAYVAKLYAAHGAASNVVEDTIRILVKNGGFEEAFLVIEEYARNNQEGGEGERLFISDQFEYIRNMKAAAVGAETEDMN